MNKKIYEVDFDSIDDCRKLISIMKSRIGELNSKSKDFISRNQMVRIKFNSCNEILETDISDLYENLNLDPTPKYYVYVHCDPNKKIALKKDGVSTFGATLGMTHLPFYIGKGTGNRAYELDRNETHRKFRQKFKIFDKDLVVNILKTDLTEKEALILESKLIDIFGLISFGGRLVNLDEGVNQKERKSRYKEQLHKLSLYYKNSV